MKRPLIVLCCGCCVLFAATAAASGEQPALQRDDPVGAFEGFDVTVPAGNYYFAKGAIRVFGTKWGGQPQTDAELEERVWEDLLLSFEAFRRNIIVTDAEVGEEADKILKSEKAVFDRTKEPSAYEAWIKEKTAEPRELFENQLRHLIQIEKLRKAVMEGFNPPVTEEEAHQEFLNEYNTLSVEMAQFDGKQPADAFYRRVKRSAALWGKEVKENPKLFRRPGFVALEFLMEMWQFPKTDAYKMLALDVGAVYAPIPIYGGKYGVCRILQKRRADEEGYPKVRQSYFDQVKMKKKYDELIAWIKRLKAAARIKVYKRVEVVSPAMLSAHDVPPTPRKE